MARGGGEREVKELKGSVEEVEGLCGGRYCWVTDSSGLLFYTAGWGMYGMSTISCC